MSEIVRMEAYEADEARHLQRVLAAFDPLPALSGRRNLPIERGLVDTPPALAACLGERGLALRSELESLGGRVVKILAAASDRAVNVELWRCGSATVSCAAESLAVARELREAVIAALPARSEPADASLVPMRFWRHTCHGADSTERELICPDLNAIRDNYPSAVQRGLERLTTLDNPEERGRVLLWQGEPGTGKTHAVRALARDWAARLGARIEVVVDPETLFARGDYLHEVLLDGNEETDEEALEGDPDGRARGRRAPRRLIILEDCAELFADACRETPGFSRLLNLSDGLLGQGLRLFFLLTANEGLERIDPALLRAGRCLSLLPFEPFSPAESKAWLKSRGCGDELAAVTEAQTLAQLYGRLQELESASPA